MLEYTILGIKLEYFRTLVLFLHECSAAHMHGDNIL